MGVKEHQILNLLSWKGLHRQPFCKEIDGWSATKRGFQRADKVLYSSDNPEETLKGGQRLQSCQGTSPQPGWRKMLHQ